MSDLFGNHIVGFPTRQLTCFTVLRVVIDSGLFRIEFIAVKMILISGMR